jgi:hypothetical protein
MPDVVVSKHYVSVAFSTAVSSCKIEWEVLVFVIGDQNKWFLGLPVFYESVDGGVLGRLVIRFYQFRGCFAATEFRSVL